MTPSEKAKELVSSFGSIGLAYIATETAMEALYDEGIKEPQYWYDVQQALDDLLEEINQQKQ